MIITGVVTTIVAVDIAEEATAGVEKIEAVINVVDKEVVMIVGVEDKEVVMIVEVEEDMAVVKLVLGMIGEKKMMNTMI